MKYVRCCRESGDKNTVEMVFIGAVAWCNVVINSRHTFQKR